MSQENVDTLLGGYEWFRVNGRFPAHLATPDFVWDMSHFDGWPEQQVYEGVQGAEDFLAEWGSSWDDWEIEIEAMHDVDDKVVAIVHQRGRSKISGMPVESMMAHLWTFRDGKEARVDVYSDPSEALKAVGLSE
jgi:ketosteroid isomerase-like protein